MITAFLLEGVSRYFRIWHKADVTVALMNVRC
jgi:hypothetical protein